MSWKIAVQKPGKYRVELNYSLIPDCEGSKVAIQVGGQSVTAKPKAGADWTDFREGQAGEVTISGTGYFPVVVKAVSRPGNYVLNLRSVTLAPADLPTTALDIGDKPATQGSNGSIKLTATEAQIDGEVARLEGERNSTSCGAVIRTLASHGRFLWGNRADSMSWSLIRCKRVTAAT